MICGQLRGLTLRWSVFQTVLSITSDAPFESLGSEFSESAMVKFEPFCVKKLRNVEPSKCRLVI